MSALGEPVALYSYVDEDGALLHEVVRYQPKTFRHRHPDGRGGYNWSLNGTRRVPYQLPSLRSAALDKRSVVVCEGEKDADALTAQGFVGTTSAGGAGWKWTPEFAAHFAGVPRIIVIPDADAPGRKAAHDRAEVLARICDDVRVCELAPERSDGFDVSDWLDAGNGADALRERMNGAPRYQPGSIEAEPIKNDLTARIQSAADLAGTPPDEILWDVERLLPADDAPTLIFGPPGSLKSWLALHLCDCIVNGRRFLGQFFARKRSGALFINLDAGAKSFRNRIRRVSESSGFRFVSLSSAEFNLDVLRILLAAHRGAFVVIDCWSSIYNPDRNLEPGFAMKTFVDKLRDLYVEFGCGGLVIDHPHRPKERGEAGDYYGSIQKEAGFRAMWAVVAEAPESGKPRSTKISCRKLSEGEPFTVVDAIVDFSDDRITFKATNDNTDTSVRETAIEAKVIEWARRRAETFSKTTVEEGVRGARVTDVRNAFVDLVERGVFVEAGARGGGKTYRLAESVPHPVPDHPVPIENRDGTGWSVLDEGASPSGPSESVPEPDGVVDSGDWFF